jgi:hypothetical protein
MPKRASITDPPMFPVRVYSAEQVDRINQLRNSHFPILSVAEAIEWLKLKPIQKTAGLLGDDHPAGAQLTAARQRGLASRWDDRIESDKKQKRAAA